MASSPRFLIVHTWGLGDWLFFAPTLQQLRAQFPTAQIDLILGTPATEAVARLSGNFNHIATFDVRRQPWKILFLAQKFRGYHYEAVIFTAGPSSRKIDFTAALFKAQKKIALLTSVHPVWFLTHSEPLNAELHMVENNLKLLDLLHIPRPAEPFPVIKLNKPVSAAHKIVIHPGCDRANAYRRWPADHFAQLISSLLEKSLAVEVLLGPDELELEEAFSSLRSRPGFELHKNLPLAQVYEHIAAARLFMSSDSGLGHIAAALNRPVLTIMGPANANATRPYARTSVVIEPTIPLSCRPCVGPNGQHGCAERPCLYSISVERVTSEIDRFLRVIDQ